jgi:PAS domain S-box-containing protein
MALTEKATTILTIDDEESLRRSIREYLEDYNYKVIEAEDGQAGQEVFLTKNPDLVLVDLRMPKADGLEVLQFVKKKRPETPIIVISGTGHIANVVEALRLGAWDYILKPIQDMTVLLHAVEKALERARMIRERRLYRERLEEEVAGKTKELHLSNEYLNREIVVRTQAENEIRWTKDYLSNVINSIPVMLTTIDSAGIITQWNLAAEEYTGIPSDHAVSKNLWQLVPFLEEYRSDFEKVRISGKPGERQGEALINGKKKYLRITLSPLAQKPGAVI